MKLMVVAVGTLKDKHYRDACAEYQKRMQPMRPVDVIALREEPLAEDAAPAAAQKALEREGARILGALQPDDTVVALSPDGRQLDSEAFAAAIGPAAYPGSKRLVFVLGSSHGLCPAVYARCHWRLSFGLMTFPRQLALVILLEQIYRGQMITLGRAYHK